MMIITDGSRGVDREVRKDQGVPVYYICSPQRRVSGSIRSERIDVFFLSDYDLNAAYRFTILSEGGSSMKINEAAEQAGLEVNGPSNIMRNRDFSI